MGLFTPKLHFFMKKLPFYFGGNKKMPTFASQYGNKVFRIAYFGIWCNGNTADSGPAFPGSSPGIPTQKSAIIQVALFLFGEGNKEV